MPSESTFYPNIGSLVNLDDLPEALSFLRPKLQDLLDSAYYRNLQVIESSDGSRGAYDLELIIPKELSEFELFDTGLSLVLFPGESDYSYLHVIFSYGWPALALIRNFSTDSFSYSPEAMLDLLDRSISVSDTDNLSVSVRLFEGGETLSAVSSFIDKVNTEYSLTGADALPYPSDTDFSSMINDTVQAINSNAVFSENTNVQGIVIDLYLNTSVPGFMQNLESYAYALLNRSIWDYIKDLIIPSADASVYVSLGLAFPEKWLKPVKTKLGEPAPENARSILVFDVGSLYFSTDGGFGFQEDIHAELNYMSEIGNTGILIDFSNVKLDLSRTSNIIEADLDGRPDDFIGIYAESITVELPQKWFGDSSEPSTLAIGGRDLLIGTGGISGTIALSAVNPENEITANDYLWKKVGGENGFQVGFNNFDITFRQNVITESNIQGALKIPRFTNSQGSPFQIDVKGHINEAGDFNLTASVDGGVPANLFGFVTFNFLSLEVGRDDDKFYLGTSCEVSFPNALMQKIIGDQKIVLSNLRIYSDGSMELLGGTNSLPVNVNLHLGPVDISVTGISFGSYQRNDRQYNYFGFDGSISIAPIGVDARGKGLKYYYTVDNLNIAA